MRPTSSRWLARFVTSLAPTLALVAAPLAACDSPGSSSGVTADAHADATGDATATSTADATTSTEPDTTATDDTAGVPDDTALPPEDTALPPEDTALPPEDTSVPPEDTAVPPEDTTVPPEEVAVTCATLDLGPTDVVLTTKPITTTAPTLTGSTGATMSGDYLLDLVDIYPKGAFNTGLVSEATLTNNGESSGRTAFMADSEWGYLLDLDLHYKLVSIAGTFEGDSRQTVSGSGPYTLSGVKILSDTSACADGWPEGATPPDEFEYQYSADSGAFKLKVVLSKEFIIALVPPDQQGLAGLAVTGPLVLVLTLSAAP